ncbi:hypothetical protein HYPSUDRAFT_204388 [Hypholoma sublateritium FD-334 SS-4]|uniref:Uncharacterized protein n=1 Tax=Hypholoma sublateritium (strain FD-334 SS-4) TaxID=945553 RepID=A0A0D2NSR3_HYPSF|nr:hypothetical protein HYPSUDRAFT_204388 [Hypholoma sublateritium FD-334 SS-4]
MSYSSEHGSTLVNPSFYSPASSASGDSVSSTQQARDQANADFHRQYYVSEGNVYPRPNSPVFDIPIHGALPNPDLASPPPSPSPPSSYHSFNDSPPSSPEH